ncbi:glycosyltransferase family 2 protein [Tardisphaera saccharovorans]
MYFPRISVIVTAYDRKKYLLGAVKSALNQTLSRDLYEVIVVKNFRDDFIDSKLGEWGVTNLYSESVGFGAMVYEALQVDRGDVISFLDDDEFLSGKLKAVYEAFQRGADYYHNGRLVINESGAKLRKEGESALISGEEAKRSWMRWLLFHAAFHNNSSVSVRRRLLGKELKKIDLSLDAYCFVASLLKGDVIVDDPRPLTLFRVHGDHVGVDLRSREINEAKLSEAGKRHLQDAFYLYGLPARRHMKKSSSIFS